MLGKMIKYDMRFGAKKYAFMAALLVGLFLMIGVARVLENDLLMGIAIFAAIIASIALSVLYLVISVQHLYSQLCGRESYLSYSLPVTSGTLLLSKLICIFIWSILTTLMIVLLWTLGIDLMLLRPTGHSLADAWRAFAGAIPDDQWAQLIRIIPFFAGLMVLSVLQSIVMMAVCVGLVNVPTLKERGVGIPAAIITYFVGGQIFGLIEVGLFYLLFRGRFVVIDNVSTLDVQTTDTLIMFLVYLISFTALFTAGCYCAANHLIGRKRSI